MSATVPIVKLETVRSAEFCADVTVYVPVNVVPADRAVSSTVAPVSSVAVSVLPDWIASLVVAVMLIDAPALYDPSAVDEEKLDTVGAVTSRVIVVVAVAADAGPVLPAASEAPAAAKTGMIVPPVVHVTVTVREAPESVSGAKVQVAVPLLEKSPIATPVTVSENVSAYAMLDAFVGDETADVNDDTVGAVVSTTIALAPAMLFTPVGTVVDVIALPAVSATVPIVKLDTVRSAEFCVAATVYVPDSVVPADAAVNSTVAPVSSVTVSVLPDWIASLAVAVTLIVAPALYDPSIVEDEKLATVGAVTSRVIVVVAVAADAGPVLPAASVAPPKAKTGITVPPVVHVTVTVRELPESVPGANVQLAVPLFEKSPTATPVTASENVNVYVTLDAFVGDETADVNDDTVGAVTSRVMVVVAVAADAGPVLPAVSVAPPTAKTGMIVPSPQLVIVTVRDEPESVPGANEQLNAVPEFEKSPAATPVTASENVNVYAMLAEFVGVDCADVKLDTVGAVVSITIALAPAMLLAPDGTVVDDIALPTVSATVPIVKLETVRSDDVCDAPTVYVPVSDVPADAAVSSTVAPVSSVTVSVLPDRIASLVVAVMLIVAPAL